MYDVETREIALMELDSRGGSVAAAARSLGLSPETLRRWAADRGRALAGRKPGVFLPYETKRALLRRLAAGEGARSLAGEAGVAPETILGWRRRLAEGGELALMDEGSLRAAAPVPPDGGAGLGEEALRERVRELELRNAVLEQMLEILKKDPGADASAPTNREKALMAEGLRGRFPLREALAAVGLARSTYYDQMAAMRRPDKYAALRERVAALFEAKGRAWGSERLWAELRRPHDGGEPVRVSEKVVRRIMAEGGMRVAYARPARGYSSYAGEVSRHPGNLVNRDFTADAPNRLWLTDITQFSLPGFRCYLSPVVDCFDGRVVAWGMSRSPSAALANSMLEEACAGLSEGEAPVVHSDCGCHYRWPGWIAICEERGLTRSMSAKGCSPDNSAMEGFFGRLKNEMFHHRDWEGVTYEEFELAVAAYIEDYNETRIKKSLGWMSPNEYRRSLGLAA